MVEALTRFVKVAAAPTYELTLLRGRVKNIGTTSKATNPRKSRIRKRMKREEPLKNAEEAEIIA